MRYVIGWLHAKPGKRDEFLALAKPVFAITRKEDGCLFYEAHPSADDPNLIMLVEGWQTAEQHLAHQKAPHHATFLPKLVEFCVGGRFDEIDAQNVVSLTPTF